MTSLDLNCDLGEGGAHDAELMPLISSANIACGAHAGDAQTMQAAVALAQRHGVAIGAHPGFADREYFGRRELELPPSGIERLVGEQVNALRALAPLRHVKPHGGLYNRAACDRACAEAVARAVRAVDPALVLYALAGSELVRAGRAAGLRVAEEVFADRTYRADGSLTPRSEPGALIESEDAMVVQVLQVVREGIVRSIDGVDVKIVADTVCLHGDGSQVVAFARRLRTALESAGIEIAAMAAAR
ncbi:5-oxoprolinase subunit PxpA [Opitutus terrae]|uniref:LamB/YcsF family protein n=1 Tax=Opitutus terrae (strain DSM 11246 / JCM 15787 / PB90-1) TaxID=452637 RepID=B1ZX56_OPITP|nr:5-oxoprolinase subunit PxpA [Opitutus terrae]ACB76108.1 LamB/YcsF family protein [Opitutus terrae PB90-1]